MSGITNGIEMPEYCQALQMDLKRDNMSGITNGIETPDILSGVTNGIEMRHICQALQMDLKCLTYCLISITNGIEYETHFNVTFGTPEYETIFRRSKWNV